MKHLTGMWQIYLYEGQELTVIQQWLDPFGRPMLRLGMLREGEVLALGMQEAEFLAAATYLRENGEELVEGAR